MPHTSENKTRSPLSIVAAAPHTLRFISRIKGKHFPFAVRVALVAACVAVLAIVASIVPHAQRGKEKGVRVNSVSARQTAQGSVYTLSADAPVARPQTWHDAEGLHVVIYKAQSANASVPRGVTQRRIGDSLELVFPARESGSVAVRQQGNNLEVVVNEAVSREAGGEIATRRDIARPQQTANGSTLNGARTERRAAKSKRGTSVVSPSPAAPEETATPDLDSTETPFAGVAPNVKRAKSNGRSKAVKTTPGETENFPSAPFQNELARTPPSLSPSSSQSSQSSPSSRPSIAPSLPSQVAVLKPEPTPDLTINPGAKIVPASNTESYAEDEAQGNHFLFGSLGALLLLVGAFVFVRRQRTGDASSPSPKARQESSSSNRDARQAISKKDRRQETRRGWDKPAPVLAPVARSASQAASASSAKAGTWTAIAAAATAPLVMFGAYQIDRELNKLMGGEPHRLDVLNSRAPDDRRALETSLMKQFRGAAYDEARRRKVRATLEEYGIVARLSAALLLAPESYDRIASARVLGEIGSPAAFPFLLEALYDRDNAVRVEAVAGLGSLGVPAAIGALLDVARRHSDIPTNLLSDALARCSVPALDFDFEIGDNQPLGLAAGNSWTGEITTLEPTGQIQSLPEWLDDEIFNDVMQSLDAADTEARTAAARELAQFKAQPAVEALMRLAAHDEAAMVRAAAVTSLGAIDHESVFVPVLLRLIDDAREVRAAAARSISRFGFDRADAYVRVIENADSDTLQQIARALIEAGLAAQAIDRLGSEDRRQGYEAFSLLSVVVKGGEAQIIIDAVAGHDDNAVRLALVRFLRISCDERALASLRELAGSDTLPAGVRAAIVETNPNEDVAEQIETVAVEV